MPWRLSERLPGEWVLIGGLMVQLLAIEQGVGDVRPTADIDVLGQGRPQGSLELPVLWARPISGAPCSRTGAALLKVEDRLWQLRHGPRPGNVRRFRRGRRVFAGLVGHRYELSAAASARPAVSSTREASASARNSVKRSTAGRFSSRRSSKASASAMSTVGCSVIRCSQSDLYGRQVWRVGRRSRLPPR
jgi:hypothetical protein